MYNEIRVQCYRYFVFHLFQLYPLLLWLLKNVLMLKSNFNIIVHI